MPTPNPDTYTAGLGEIIRAARLYMGLSKDGMAKKLTMSDRSYERIESGERDCPPGLLDSIDALIDAFEDQVEEVITAARESATSTLEISGDPRQEWRRCVVGRAALESRALLPVLIDGDWV